MVGGSSASVREAIFAAPQAYSVWLKYYEVLCQRMNMFDEYHKFFRLLVGGEVITTWEEARVRFNSNRKHRSRIEANRVLLKLIRGRWEYAFPVLCRSLKVGSNQGYLAEMMRRNLHTDLLEVYEFLAANIEMYYWTALMKQLGLSKDLIERAKRENALPEDKRVKRRKSPRQLIKKLDAALRTVGCLDLADQLLEFEHFLGVFGMNTWTEKVMTDVPMDNIYTPRGPSRAAQSAGAVSQQEDKQEDEQKRPDSAASSTHNSTFDKFIAIRGTHPTRRFKHSSRNPRDCVTIYDSPMSFLRGVASRASVRSALSWDAMYVHDLTPRETTPAPSPRTPKTPWLPPIINDAAVSPTKRTARAVTFGGEQTPMEPERPVSTTGSDKENMDVTS
ncbi:hypothetical protein Bbelb_295910 [Branchiostoma belcheri]|nr:hypothetical protein Bbelb_295910 [Branchiostoma belcheri]